MGGGMEEVRKRRIARGGENAKGRGWVPAA
jgi:hypothetical protein